MADRKRNTVQLGFGTLILIALIVVMFSGRNEVRKLERKIQALTEQIVVLQNEMNAPPLIWDPVHTDTGRQHIDWVAKCLADFESIKPGMRREDIEERFPLDGGLQFPSPVRFLHPSCSYFKIDVEFDFERDPGDQNRAIKGKDDKVTDVSRPYIERMKVD